MHRAVPHNRTSILFVVITSRETKQRALDAFTSWCASAEAQGSYCRFVADLPFDAERNWSAPSGMHWTVLSAPPPPASCCRGKTGFFCSKHRRRTLSAQYRFLPALSLATKLDPIVSGRTQWVVLLDDDSFVFVRRLRRMLVTQYKHAQSQPVMLGEFKSDTSYACGGAGAVLSRSALLRLNVDACIARTRRRCMQSDWQLGECVRMATRRRVASGTSGVSSRDVSHGIKMETQLGCGTCAVDRNCSGRDNLRRCAAPLRAGCHFMQDAGPHARWLLQTANCSRLRSPSIVHGSALVSADGGYVPEATQEAAAEGYKVTRLAAVLAQRHRSAARSSRAACAEPA